MRPHFMVAVDGKDGDRQGFQIFFCPTVMLAAVIVDAGIAKDD